MALEPQMFRLKAYIGNFGCLYSACYELIVWSPGILIRMLQSPVASLPCQHFIPTSMGTRWTNLPVQTQPSLKTLLKGVDLPVASRLAHKLVLDDDKVAAMNLLSNAHLMVENHD